MCLTRPTRNSSCEILDGTFRFSLWHLYVILMVYVRFGTTSHLKAQTSTSLLFILKGPLTFKVTSIGTSKSNSFVCIFSMNAQVTYLCFCESDVTRSPCANIRMPIVDDLLLRFLRHARERMFI